MYKAPQLEITELWLFFRTQLVDIKAKFVLVLSVIITAKRAKILNLFQTF